MSLEDLDESSAILRDQWGRPLIIPPKGGKAVGYRRPSTLGNAIDDTSTLEKYSTRMVALGLAQRRDLFGIVAHTDIDDKATLNAVCSQAKEAAGGSIKANMGTALHKLIERYDAGLDPTPVDELDENALRAWQRFRSVTGWSVRDHERFVVCDEIKAAGSLDLVMNGRVTDIKTGSVDYALKFGAQLATYSHSVGYAVVGGEAVRTPLGVEPDVGYILHFPHPFTVVECYEIDLALGWKLAKLSVDIINARSKAKKLLTGPLVFNPPPWETKTQIAVETSTEPGTGQLPPAEAAIAPEGREAGQSGADPLGSPSLDDLATLVRGTIEALPLAQRANVYRWGKEARLAGVPIDLSKAPDERSLAIGQAMMEWAFFTDDVVKAAFGECSITTTPQPVGVQFGILTADGARALIEYAQR